MNLVETILLDLAEDKNYLPGIHNPYKYILKNYIRKNNSYILDWIRESLKNIDWGLIECLIFQYRQEYKVLLNCPKCGNHLYENRIRIIDEEDMK